MAKKKKRSRKSAPILAHRNREIGAPPGSLIAAPSTPAVIHAMAFGPDTFREVAVNAIAEIRALRGTMPVLWVNITGRGDAAAFKELGEMFGLHRLALEDALNSGQRPKVDEYDGHAFIVVHEALDGETLTLDQISMFVGKDFVITMQEHAGDCLEIIRERIRHGRGRVRKAGADYLAYALIDAILDHYFPIIERYGDQLENLEAEIVQCSGDDSAPEIHRIRHELHVMRRLLGPTREAIGTLARGEIEVIREDSYVFLRDLLDHANQLQDALDSCYDFSAGLMDLHFWNVNQRMNDTMRLLTIISTIFIPLSFIAGVYGMNFSDMPELRWQYGYPFALGLMGLTAALLLLLFVRMGWFKEAAAARQKRREIQDARDERRADDSP